MYCGASLARVGCDFRPLLEPIFEAAIAVLFKGALAGAEASFASLLAVPSWGASGAGQASRDGAGERGADADGGPSMEILEFPFLAALTNGVLAGEMMPSSLSWATCGVPAAAGARWGHGSGPVVAVHPGSDGMLDGMLTERGWTHEMAEA